MTCPCKTIPLVRAFALLSLVFSMSGCGISPEVYRREVEARRAAENRAAAAENRAHAAETRAAEAERRLLLASKTWLYIAVTALILVAVEGCFIAYLRGKAAEESSTRPILMELLWQQRLAGPETSQSLPDSESRRLPWTN